MLDDPVFAHESGLLIDRSPFKNRIELLLQDPVLGMQFYNGPDKRIDKGPSNCHGTVLYAAGISKLDLPVPVPRSDMLNFIKKSCSPGLKEGSIVIFLTYDKQLYHAGLYLGRASMFGDVMFHQLDTGEKYSVNRIEEYLRWFSDAELYSFYTINASSNI